eukprot:TRINITY_DN80698_c0_g1_i1.p1 TRINITY_DN80698_c0_g1~~TRINITY_DN80698_c0_g1_i1.p1  ORF type:complete len:101 (+),score=16.87 TRINITY_DN80698_c0_g1_i1:39-305(+)
MRLREAWLVEEKVPLGALPLPREWRSKHFPSRISHTSPLLLVLRRTGGTWLGGRRLLDAADACQGFINQQQKSKKKKKKETIEKLIET